MVFGRNSTPLDLSGVSRVNDQDDHTGQDDAGDIAQKEAAINKILQRDDTSVLDNSDDSTDSASPASTASNDHPQAKTNDGPSQSGGVLDLDVGDEDEEEPASPTDTEAKPSTSNENSDSNASTNTAASPSQVVDDIDHEVNEIIERLSSERDTLEAEISGNNKEIKELQAQIAGHQERKAQIDKKIAGLKDVVDNEKLKK